MTLLIECATERSVVALYDKGVLYETSPIERGIDHPSSQLLPKIDECLKHREKTLFDIEKIGIGVGPGSYTGIRVGAVIVKTIAYIHNIPLIPLISLETFSPDQDGQFAVVFDAKMRGISLFIGEKKGEEIVPLFKSKTLLLEDAIGLLEDVPLILSPNGVRLEKMYPTLKIHTASPSPKRMLHLVEEKWKKKEYKTDARLDLIYQLS